MDKGFKKKHGPKEKQSLSLVSLLLSTPRGSDLLIKETLDDHHVTQKKKVKQVQSTVVVVLLSFGIMDRDRDRAVDKCRGGERDSN